MNLNEIDIPLIINKILSSRKYRDSGLNPETIQDLILKEIDKQPTEKALVKSVRRKLHNIVAPYLGEPDYSKLITQLEKIENPIPSHPEIKELCWEALSKHASTKERLPFITSFYDQLFKQTGKPSSVLDLACGLHPLAFPWMGLETSIQYHAYDIIQPRIEFINIYFKKIGLAPLAENRDVLVNPPKIKADLAIFFKEAHRFQKRQLGCNQDFWENLNVDKLVVSLPAQDLSGTHNLSAQQRELVNNNLPLHQGVLELLIENELIFIIDKNGG